jgi:hypothetical protein
MRLCRRATGHLRASSSTSALPLSDRGSARGKPPVGNAVCRTPGPCCDNLDFDQRLWPYELWDYQEHRGRPDPSKGSSADLCIGRDVLGSVKYCVALDGWSRDLMVHSSRRCGRKRYGPGSPGGTTTHLADFVAAYNFVRRFKTLRGLTPCEFRCHSESFESLIDRRFSCSLKSFYFIRCQPRFRESITHNSSISLIKIAVRL